jgi:hypothetical protein
MPNSRLLVVASRRGRIQSSARRHVSAAVGACLRRCLVQQIQGFVSVVYLLMEDSIGRARLGLQGKSRRRCGGCLMISTGQGWMDKRGRHDGERGR